MHHISIISQMAMTAIVNKNIILSVLVVVIEE